MKRELKKYLFYTFKAEPSTLTELEKYADMKKVYRTLEKICDVNRYAKRNAAFPCYLKYDEKTDTFHINSEWVGNFKSYTRYFCCPECDTFSHIHSFFTPKNGWDELKKKYADTAIISALQKSISSWNQHNQCNAEEAVLFSSNEDEFITNVAICPHCGAKLPLKLKDDLFKVDDEVILWRLYRKMDEESNIVDYSYEIFDEDRDGKETDLVRFSLVRAKLYPNVYGKIHMPLFITRYVFNTKTGQSYVFREISMDTKKPVNTSDAKIRNITYSTIYRKIHIAVMEQLIRAIAKKRSICEDNIEAFMECCRDAAGKGLLYISTASAFNRFGGFSPSFIKDYMSMRLFMNTCAQTWLYRIAEEENFKNAIKKHDITSKALIRKTAENPMCFFYVCFLRRMGFMDINNILTMIDGAHTFLSKIGILLVSVNKNGLIRYDGSSMAKLLDAMKEVIGETAITRKLVGFSKEIECKNADFRIMTDAATMFNCCRDEIEISKNLFKGTIIEIHDRLSAINNTINQVSMRIPYHLSENVNCQYDGYKFLLAKNTLELREVGSKMGICVGSYSDYACRKYGNIVIMYDRDNVPQACIQLERRNNCNDRINALGIFELDERDCDDSEEHDSSCSDEDFVCLQFKDYHNHHVDDAKKAEAARAFLEMNKIDYKTCSDIRDSKIINADFNPSIFRKIGGMDEYLIYDDNQQLMPVPMEGSTCIEGVIIKKTKNYHHFNDPLLEPFY